MLQRRPANPPSNYVPSSPSPAASGGSSAFKDSRHRSPWIEASEEHDSTQAALYICKFLGTLAISQLGRAHS
jgi:hypothetical protein